MTVNTRNEYTLGVVDTAGGIKAARAAAEITQRELAARTGFTVTTIARYESGDQNPSMDALERLSAALGCPPGALLAAPEAAP